MLVRSHDPDESFYTIIHIHERACLLAITPNFDLAILLGKSYLTTNSGRTFSLTPFERAQRSVDRLRDRVYSQSLRQ
jgi:hypothetical protein